MRHLRWQRSSPRQPPDDETLFDLQRDGDGSLGSEMKLFPAVKYNGELFVGDERDNHDAIKERHNLPSDLPDSAHVFSPSKSGPALSRKMALGWLKTYDPSIYAKVVKTTPPEGLHSQNLAAAKGIKQRSVSSVIDLSTKEAIVFDRGGLYTYWAQKHGEYYGKLHYYMPDSSAYPESPRAHIGKGLQEIRRINDEQFFKLLKKDKQIILFPDCYNGADQNFFRSLGHDVFGGGVAEKLEYNKKLFLAALASCGLFVPKTIHITGLDELIAHLDGKGEKWIKPLFRGDFETRKYDNMEQFRSWIDQEIRPKLAGTSKVFQALVQDPFPSECEIGYDGELIDDEYCEDHLQGIEEKDAFLVSIFKRKIAERSRKMLYAFLPELLKYGAYRGALSTEQRESENKTAFVDLTARIGSPPGELQCEQIKDYPKGVYQVARGIIPKKDANGLFGAEIILTSEWYCSHELTVQFPKEFTQNVKLKCHYKDGNAYKCVPNGNGAFFGAVVAWGSKWQDACEKAVEIAKSVNAEGYSFKDNPASFDNISRSMEAAKKYGYDFTSEDK